MNLQSCLNSHASDAKEKLKKNKKKIVALYILVK